MKKLLLVLLTLALLLAGVFALFRVQIAEQLFERAVSANVGADPMADLPDGLHVFLCGTGSPMADDLRAGPCIAVVAGRRAFVFDAGSGSIRKLGRMGFPMGLLDTVYLTHLHSDHLDGLGELLLQAWIAGGRATPLPVAGPVGTRSVVEGFNAAYRIDRGYRIAHHGEDVANPAGSGGRWQEIELAERELAPKTVYERDGVRIQAIRVDHAPVRPAFGYRVDYKDRSVAISGDTVYHPGLVAAAQGVDLLLHEALDPEMVKRMGAALAARGRTSAATIFEDILDYHATPEDAARAAQEAGVGELVYYHIVPPLPSRLLHPLFLGEAADVFDGPITIGADGLVISLPAGSAEIRHEQRL